MSAVGRILIAEDERRRQPVRSLTPAAPGRDVHEDPVAGGMVDRCPRGDREFGTPLALTLAYKVSDNWRLALSWARRGPRGALREPSRFLAELSRGTRDAAATRSA